MSEQRKKMFSAEVWGYHGLEERQSKGQQEVPTPAQDNGVHSLGDVKPDDEQQDEEPSAFRNFFVSISNQPL